MALADLRSYIIRARRAEDALETARRRLVDAEAEFAAARQELDDALIDEFRGVT